MNELERQHNIRNAITIIGCCCRRIEHNNVGNDELTRLCGIMRCSIWRLEQVTSKSQSDDIDD